MGSLANSIITVLLGWARTVASWIWDGGNGPLAWIASHWVLLALILIVGGTVCDLAVYLKRWQPLEVLRSYQRRKQFGPAAPEAEPETEPEAHVRARTWVYADGRDRTELVPEEEAASPLSEAELLPALSKEEDAEKGVPAPRARRGDRYRNRRMPWQYRDAEEEEEEPAAAFHAAVYPQGWTAGTNAGQGEKR